MIVTTKDIIKWLPFDSALKETLLSEIDTYTGDKKYTIENSLWETYHLLYNMRLEENLQKAFIHVKKGTEELDKEMYARVKQQTVDELEKEMRENGEASDLAQARAAMETIVREIQASKKH